MTNVSDAAEEPQEETKSTTPNSSSPAKVREAGYNLYSYSSGKDEPRSATSFVEAQTDDLAFEDEVQDSSDQLEDYTLGTEGQEFPEIGAKITDRLKHDRLAFVYGTVSNWSVLHKLASYLVRTSFSDNCRPKVFYSSGPRASVNRPSHMNTFEHLLSWIPENSKKDTLVVIFDDGLPEDSLLTRTRLDYSRGTDLLDVLRKRRNLFLLVLTEKSRFDQLIGRFHAYPLERLCHAVEIPQPAKPPRQMATELIAAIEEKHKLAGLLSAWCMAWFDRTSIDDLALCMRSVLEAQALSRRRKKRLVNHWRSDWLELLKTTESAIVEDYRSVVYLKHSRSELTAELRATWRLEQRLRHQGFLEDLRLSRLIQRAGPDLLQSFTIFFAYRANLDPSWALQIFVDLLEQWLDGADDVRTLFVLTSVFNALLFANEFDLATRALKYRLWRPYEQWTAAILFTAHEDFLSETRFIALYNQILPLIAQNITRSALWGRFLRIRARDEEQLQQTVTDCYAQLNEYNFMEFTARFAEELLLADGDVTTPENANFLHRPYRDRLIHLIRTGVGEAESPSSVLCRTIRSGPFQKYGEERTSYWSATQGDSQLLRVWVIRSLLPLMQGLPTEWLLGILGSTIFGSTSVDHGSMQASSGGWEQLIAMLLITCAAQEDDAAGEQMLRTLCSSLIAQSDDAMTVATTLRDLGARFAQAGQITQLSSENHSREEREALRQTRNFFRERTGTIARIRLTLDHQFFTSPGDL